jgi:hypothetical protein
MALSAIEEPRLLQWALNTRSGFWCATAATIIVVLIASATWWGYMRLRIVEVQEVNWQLVQKVRELEKARAAKAPASAAQGQQARRVSLDEVLQSTRPALDTTYARDDRGLLTLRGTAASARDVRTWMIYQDSEGMRPRLLALSGQPPHVSWSVQLGTRVSSESKRNPAKRDETGTGEELRNSDLSILDVAVVSVPLIAVLLALGKPVQAARLRAGLAEASKQPVSAWSAGTRVVVWAHLAWLSTFILSELALSDLANEKIAEQKKQLQLRAQVARMEQPR